MAKSKKRITGKSFRVVREVGTRKPTKGRAKRPEAYYRLALTGYRSEPDAPREIGLRDAASGFSSADGFNLNDISAWTPAMKRAVTIAHKRLAELTAQPVRVFKSRNKKHLRQAMQIKQMDEDKGIHWKVALVPGVPHFKKTGKRKGKEIPPNLKFPNPDMIVIPQGKFNNVRLKFDLVNLVKNHKKEIERLMAMTPKIRRFRIGVGPNIIVQGPAMDKPFVEKEIRALMNKYDGRRPLPSKYKNSKDAPKDHYFGQWLTGLVGWDFPKTTPRQQANAENEFNRMREKTQKGRRALKARLAYKPKTKRKGSK